MPIISTCVDSQWLIRIARQRKIRIEANRMSARPVVKTSFMDGPMQEAAIMAAQVSESLAGGRSRL